VWERVPLYLDVRFVAALLMASLSVAVLTLLAWPVAAILRRYRKRQLSEDRLARRGHLVVRLVLAMQAAAVLSGLALFFAASADVTILSDAFDPAVVGLYLIAWLGVLGSPLPIYVAWRSWRRQVGGRWARLHHALLAASALTLGWFLITWHVAGTTLNY